MRSKPLEKEELSILLLQTRKDAEMRDLERENFLQWVNLRPDQLTSLELYRHPGFDPNVIRQYDAFFMGGLSDDPKYSVQIDPEVYPFIDGLKELLATAEKYHIPGLLSCGGFMLGSHLFGGKVELDSAQKELGVYDIYLTNEGRTDPLTMHLPSPFKMVSGHNKSLVKLPPECVLLGSSEKCRNHIFKRANSWIYAFQGHPEITCTGLRRRIEPYRDKYFDDVETFERIVSLKEDTSLSNGLLQRFINVILLHDDSFVAS